MLYGACTREAKARGYQTVITYTIAHAELGTTLRAARFTPDHLGKGGSWHRPSSGRIRPNQNNTAPKQRWTRQLCPSRRKTTSSSSEARKTSPGRPTELPLFDETSNA